ncbi:hexokinase family protein [Gayadomonas joobiniege]|uniref:hexokinase family protein n=1 Tax=Gayadomonas joobiniege TaxID=1234606 RepID=UPI00036002E3|nr:hypothetical protein [Gayadomonas joobiniege]
MALPVTSTAEKFTLSNSQLHRLADDFHQQIEAGMANQASQLKCLPTHISIDPSRGYYGNAMVLDLGGSNLRAANVKLNGLGLAIEKDVNVKMPWQRGVAFCKQNLLQIQAEALAQVSQRSLPVGYCFSFPAQSIERGDAVLVEWTKGIHVPDMQGEAVGQTLTEFFAKKYGRRLLDVAVINDTVASLLAGLIDQKPDAYFGLIVGTGCNLAGLYPAYLFSQFPRQKKNLNYLAVNLESGNFIPVGLNEFDRQLDLSSENTGLQRFEKATSGLYLGRLYKLALPNTSFDPSLGAFALNQLIDSENVSNDEISVAVSIMLRSAHLVAGQLLGLALHYSARVESYVSRIKVVCEGSLFNSKSDRLGPYRQLVLNKLNQLLKERQLSSLEIELCHIPQANYMGAAVAAIANQSALAQ